MNHKNLFAMCCVLAAMLTGCGSDRKSTSTSSSSSSSSVTANVNGVFADAPVVGLSFTCGSQTGVTGSGGTFACPTGSTVKFSVGGITVCTAPVQAMMTPVSCAQLSDPKANASTPAVVAVARFLMSISTTPASSGTLTITATELLNAANQTLDFSTAGDPQLLGAVVATTGNPSATLVSAAAAQAELTNIVVAALAGNYSGTFSGSQSGTWSVSIASTGTVTGTATVTGSGSGTVSGSLVAGTQYSGTAGTATWTGTLDTSKSPIVFSGTWSDGNNSGTFTGHN